MTRLAAGGRAQQPGLACACWFWSRARENRKARIQQAAHRVWLERSQTSPAALERAALALTHGDAQKPAQRRHRNAETAFQPMRPDGNG